MNISKKMINDYLKKVEQVLIEYITDKSDDKFMSGKLITILETGIDLGVFKPKAYVALTDFVSAESLLFKFYNKKKREIVQEVKVNGREHMRLNLTDEAANTLKSSTRNKKQEVNND